MVKLRKRASKRLGVKQREKVKKKVVDHHRKARKDTKKNQQWKSRVPKDLGIPNSYPYKEQLLQEIQQKRDAAAAAKLAAKERKTQTLDEAEVDAETADLDLSEVVANHSKAKAPLQCRESLDDLVQRDDCAGVIVCVDARDPRSWVPRQMLESLKTAGKYIGVALTRADLVPKEVIQSWIAALETEHNVSVVPVSAISGQIEQISALVSLVQSWEPRSSPDARSLTLVGFENSGRTMLAKLCQTALPSFKISDSPQLIAKEQSVDERASAQRALARNKGPLQRVKDPLPLVRCLIGNVEELSDLQVAFNIPAFSGTHTREDSELQLSKSVDDFLVALARTLGRLKKGQMPDTVAAARHLLRQWSSGEVKYYSKAPALGGIRQTEPTNAVWLSALEEICLPRRSWRAKWGQKELRLKQEPVDGSLANQAVQFDRPSRGNQVRFTSDEDMEDDEEVLSDADASDMADDDDSWDDVEGNEPDKPDDQSAAEEDAEEPQLENAKHHGRVKGDFQEAAAKPGRKAQTGGTYRFADHF